MAKCQTTLLQKYLVSLYLNIFTVIRPLLPLFENDVGVKQTTQTNCVARTCTQRKHSTFRSKTFSLTVDVESKLMLFTPTRTRPLFSNWITNILSCLLCILYTYLHTHRVYEHIAWWCINTTFWVIKHILTETTFQSSSRRHGIILNVYIFSFLESGYCLW